MARNIAGGLILAAILLGLGSRLAMAASFADDFSAGLNPRYWNVSTSQPLYQWDDTHGDLRISKMVGGTYTLQLINVDFLGDLTGDFIAEVDFRDAFITRVDGIPGNQVQLNASFAGLYFAVVRSDEFPYGNNVHVFVFPPGEWKGTQFTEASSGRLRIERVGTTVAGYFGDTLLHSDTYYGGVVYQLWLSLQNNGTVDSTSVTFDNFAASAGQIATSTPSPESRSFDGLVVAPNPMRRLTTITYRVDAPGPLRISLFDVSGRMRATLLERDFVSVGTYAFDWSLEGVPHGALPGVYFVRLEGGRSVASRKVTVVR